MLILSRLIGLKISLNFLGNAAEADESSPDETPSTYQNNHNPTMRKEIPSVHSWVKEKYGQAYPICSRPEMSYGIKHSV